MRPTKDEKINYSCSRKPWHEYVLESHCNSCTCRYWIKAHECGNCVRRNTTPHQFTQIAEMLHVTKQRITQLHIKAMCKIAQRIVKEETLPFKI